MDLKLLQTRDHLLVRFDRPCCILSSAVWNGGLVEARQILNMRVPQNHHGRDTGFEAPEKALKRHAQAIGLSGTTVGMMTSASMQSYRSATASENHFWVRTIVTSGISNAKRAGERAEWRYWDEAPAIAGTINMITITDVALTPAAQVEAIMMMTEAKAATLQDLGITSIFTGTIATGTGTDALALASDPGGQRVRYCGKHVLLGEKLALTVIEALRASLRAWSPPQKNMPVPVIQDARA